MTKRRIAHLYRGIGVILATTILSGCANHPLNPQEIRTNVPKRSEAVNMLNQPAVTTLETDPSSFWTTEYDRGEKLPNIMVGPITFYNVSVEDAIRAIAQKTNIGFTEGPGLQNKKINITIPGAIPLKQLLEIISEQSGTFYEYHGGILNFEATKEFIVKIPRTEGSMLTFSEAFRNLGATNLYVDVITGSITMTADYKTYRETQRFTRTFEEGRDMLVYDIWVFEHILDRNEGIGISWDKLGFKVGHSVLGFGALSNSSSSASSTGGSTGSSGSSSGSDSSSGSSSGSGSDSTTSSAASALGALAGGAASSAASGMQFGVISNASSRIANAMLSALSNDSRTDTVSRPVLTMMSGGQAHFQVGDKQQYLSQVSNNSNSGFSGGSTQGVKPSTLETGIKMTLGGGYNDGWISTRISLDINQLVAFQQFSTGGSNSGSTNSSSSSSSSSSNNNSSSGYGSYTLELPHTTNRILHSSVDARPGDVIVLGGLIRTAYADNQQRIYHTSLPISSSMTAERTETIIFMRPRLIRFRPRGTPSIAPNEVRVAPWVGRNVKTTTGPIILGSDPMDVERIAHDASKSSPIDGASTNGANIIHDSSATNTFPNDGRMRPYVSGNPYTPPTTTNIPTPVATPPMKPLSYGNMTQTNTPPTPTANAPAPAPTTPVPPPPTEPMVPPNVTNSAKPQ